MSDTSIVNALARDIKRAMKHRNIRLPGTSRRHLTANGWVRGSVGGGRDTFTPGDAYVLLLAEDAKHPVGWRGPSQRSAWPLAERLFRRAMKKAAQPYRKNHKRGQMRRRAAGKNEVRP